MDEQDYPPSFNVEMDERQKAIYDCHQLMLQLSNEYGGEGQVRRISDNKLSVELHFDIPEGDSNNER